MFFFFSLPLRNCLPLCCSVDFAIDSCGFGDAIPHFTATKKSNKPGYVSSKRKQSLLVVCVCVVGAVGKIKRNGREVKYCFS